MRLEESSIYINLVRLREKIYGSMFHMMKGDRLVFGRPLLEASGEALGNFILAFMVKEDKVKYMDKCIGWFTRLRIDLDFCVRENIIKFKKRTHMKDKDGNVVPCETPEDKVNSQKIELFVLIGKIDNDMCKWRQSIAKGKALCE